MYSSVQKGLNKPCLAHILPISHHAWGKDTARIRSFHVYKRVGFGFPLIHHSKVKPLYRQSTLTKKTKDNTAILFSLWICDWSICHLRRGMLAHRIIGSGEWTTHRSYRAPASVAEHPLAKPTTNKHCPSPHTMARGWRRGRTKHTHTVQDISVGWSPV